MITRILQPRRSSATVLDYNREKVFNGDAELVLSENLPDDSILGIYDTFERYENNPAVDERTRTMSFHMAVNPAPEDGMSGEDVLSYIREVMTELGYGGQPYAVFRHNDIDREHYHVASVRVREDGKAIPREWEGRRVEEIQRRLAPKYGFTVGRKMPDGASEEVAVDVKEFVNDGVNVMHKLSSVFMQALQYDFHSLYQFGCVMRAMNVKASLRPRRDGGRNMVLRGLDDNGRECTRYYSLERHMGVQGVSLYTQRLEQNNAMGVLRASRKEQLLEMSDYCLENSGSEAEYRSMLAELGVVAAVLRDEPDGAIRRVTLVEKRNKALVDTSISGELFLKAFAERETSGKWSRPVPSQEDSGRGRRRAAVTQAVTVRGKHFDERRTAELNARIRRRLDAFAGKGQGAGARRPRLK